MFGSRHLRPALLIVSAALFPPGFVAAQDADTREVQNYVLTDAGLSKYALATKKLAALPRPAGACEDDDSESASLRDMVAKLDAAPGVRNAIQSAGMTTREYLVFSMSLLHNGLAAWAVSQPGGKLPPGTSKANVDFYNKHKAELEKLSGSRAGEECEEEAEDSEDTPE